MHQTHHSPIAHHAPKGPVTTTRCPPLQTFLQLPSEEPRCLNPRLVCLQLSPSHSMISHCIPRRADRGLVAALQLAVRPKVFFGPLNPNATTQQRWTPALRLPASATCPSRYSYVRFDAPLHASSRPLHETKAIVLAFCRRFPRPPTYPARLTGAGKAMHSASTIICHRHTLLAVCPVQLSKSRLAPQPPAITCTLHLALLRGPLT